MQTTAGDARNQGNILGLNSSYQTSDGISHAAADVWFAVDPQSSLDTKASSLTQAMASFDPDGYSASGALTDVGKNVAPPVQGSLAQAIQSYTALNGLSAPTQDLRMSVAPSPQLAMLAQVNNPNASLSGVLASTAVVR